MPRYAAFLRAINVGGHVVTMDRLRGIFAAMDLAAVETFIASGNVVFSSRATDRNALERRIERALGEALGYEVATFLRATEDLAAIAAREPFAAPLVTGAAANYVAFLREGPDAAAKKRVMALRSENEVFHFQGRELHVVSRLRFSESAFTGAQLEKALGAPATIRGINTVRKMAIKFTGAATAPSKGKK
jgi:uncharacterized protein (DUF1697 family)